MLFVLLDGYIIFSLIKKKKQNQKYFPKKFKKTYTPQPDIYSKIFSEKNALKIFKTKEFFYLPVNYGTIH